MKQKIWHTKNNYGGRPSTSKDRDTLLLAPRATLYSHHRDRTSTISYHEDPRKHKQTAFEHQQTTFEHLKKEITKKETRFDQLKQEITKLESSQFFCMKDRCSTEADGSENMQFKLTGKEFMPSKKIAQLEKYKMHLRKKGKTRKISLLLEGSRGQEGKEGKEEGSLINLLGPRDINIINMANNEKAPAEKDKGKGCLKRKETPSIVKKYYRPQSGHQSGQNQNHRSMS